MLTLQVLRMLFLVCIHIPASLRMDQKCPLFWLFVCTLLPPLLCILGVPLRIPLKPLLLHVFFIPFSVIVVVSVVEAATVVVLVVVVAAAVAFAVVVAIAAGVLNLLLHVRSLLPFLVLFSPLSV